MKNGKRTVRRSFNCSAPRIKQSYMLYSILLCYVIRFGQSNAMDLRKSTAEEERIIDNMNIGDYQSIA